MNVLVTATRTEGALAGEARGERSGLAGLRASKACACPALHSPAPGGRGGGGEGSGGLTGAGSGSGGGRGGGGHGGRGGANRPLLHPVAVGLAAVHCTGHGDGSGVRVPLYCSCPPAGLTRGSVGGFMVEGRGAHAVPGAP